MTEICLNCLERAAIYDMSANKSGPLCEECSIQLGFEKGELERV